MPPRFSRSCAGARRCDEQNRKDLHGAQDNGGGGAEDRWNTIVPVYADVNLVAHAGSRSGPVALLHIVTPIHPWGKRSQTAVFRQGDDWLKH